MLRSVFQEQASDAEKFIVLHAPQTLKGEREREGNDLKYTKNDVVHQR